VRLAAAQGLVVQLGAGKGQEPAGIRRRVPPALLRNRTTGAGCSGFIKSVSPDREIYCWFFLRQLHSQEQSLALEELEGKEGGRRDLGWLRKAGSKQQALEEQGFVVFEKWGRKESWQTYVCKLDFEM